MDINFNKLRWSSHAMHRLYERFAIKKEEVDFLLRNHIYLFSGFERNKRYGHFLMYSHFDNDFIIPVISKDLYNIVTVLKIAFDSIVHSFDSQDYVKTLTLNFINSRQTIVFSKMPNNLPEKAQEIISEYTSGKEGINIKRREPMAPDIEVCPKISEYTTSVKPITEQSVKTLDSEYKKSIVYRLNLDLSIEYTYNDPRLLKDISRSRFHSGKFNEVAFNELTEEMKRQLKSVSTIREGFRLTDKNKVSQYSILYFSSKGDKQYLASISCDWEHRSLAHLRYRVIHTIYNFIRFVEKDPIIFIVPKDNEGNPIEYRLFYNGFYKNSKVSELHSYTELPKDKLVS